MKYFKFGLLIYTFSSLPLSASSDANDSEDIFAAPAGKRYSRAVALFRSNEPQDRDRAWRLLCSVLDDNWLWYTSVNVRRGVAITLSQCSSDPHHQNTMCQLAFSAINDGWDIHSEPPNIRYSIGTALIQSRARGYHVHRERGFRILSLLGAEGHTQSLVAISAYCFDCARDGSIDHDREEGEQYLRKASDLGDPYAQYEYGMRLVEGREVPKKAQMGKNLLRVAADSGNPLIQCDYAQLMFDGTEDIHRDRREAQVYFERAIAQDPSLDIPLEIGLRIKADGGDHNAQFDLAMRLLAGDGVDQNVEEGIFYLKKAADGGHFDAIREYSDRLFDGNGVEQDVDAAEQYSRLAEISEHPDTAEG